MVIISVKEASGFSDCWMLSLCRDWFAKMTFSEKSIRTDLLLTRQWKMNLSLQKTCQLRWNNSREKLPCTSLRIEKHSGNSLKQCLSIYVPLCSRTIQRRCFIFCLYPDVISSFLISHCPGFWFCPAVLHFLKLKSETCMMIPPRTAMQALDSIPPTRALLKEVRKGGTFFPSPQLCSACGFQNPEFKEPEYTCMDLSRKWRDITGISMLLRI